MRVISVESSQSVYSLYTANLFCHLQIKYCIKNTKYKNASPLNFQITHIILTVSN